MNRFILAWSEFLVDLAALLRPRHLCFAIVMTVSVTASGREIVFQLAGRNAQIPLTGNLIIAHGGSPSARQKVALHAGKASIDLPSDSEWVVTLDAEGWWAAPQIIDADVAMSSMVLPTWRTGIIRGRFVLADDPSMPKTARLVIETPPDLRVPPEIPRHTTFECPVDDTGAWSCHLPATTLDVAVVVAGFLPLYRWDLEVDQAHDTLLGTIPLRRGASLVAWLDGESTRSLEGPAKARLLRGVGSEPSITALRLASPVAEATFGKRGGVQLTDLPPGMYLLEVTAQGFAPSRIFPIEIRDQREAVLRRPILLERPLTLRLVIDPPLDPSGAPWNVELRRRNGFGEGSGDPAPITIRRLTDPAGAFEACDQSTGRYTLEVRDARREFRVIRGLEIASETDSQQTISIAYVRVRGTVTFGGEPVAARLFFGGRHGAERMTLDANPDGVFEGSLARPGLWPVDVEIPSKEARSSVNVVVSDGEQDIAVDIPDTTLTGAVIGVDGERAGQASVTLISEASGSFDLRTKSDGTFRFRGVQPGAATLLARDLRTAESSQAVSIVVAERAENRVDLRIESGRKLVGTVISGGAPVAGAVVSAYPIVDGWSSQVRAICDVTGKFELQLPISTRQALLAVSAPGRVLQSFDVAVGNEPVLLDLATAGGTVQMLLPPAGSPFVLQRDGVVVPTIDLMRWADEQGQRAVDGRSMSISNLAPGMYRACIPMSSRCVQRALTPNITVDLDLQ